MLGKFAVVQRSLLPELLTAATPAPDSSSRQPGRALQLYTPHIEQGGGRSYDEVVILSALLGRDVWQYGELQSIAVLVWCCKARGWGGVPGLGVGAGSV